MYNNSTFIGNNPAFVEMMKPYGYVYRQTVETDSNGDARVVNHYRFPKMSVRENRHNT